MLDVSMVTNQCCSNTDSLLMREKAAQFYNLGMDPEYKTKIPRMGWNIDLITDQNSAIPHLNMGNWEWSKF